MDVKGLTKHLKQKGFRPSYYKGSGRLAYAGTLNIFDIAIHVKIVFKTSAPTDFPDVYIVNWEHDDALQQKLGVVNISKEGNLCYIDPVEVWWDSSRAPEFIEAVLCRVEEALLKKIAGHRDDDEFHRDFTAYWDGDVVYSKTTLKDNRSYNIQVIDNLKWLDNGPSDSASRYFCIGTPKLPVPETYQSWPPSTLLEFISWIEADPKIYKLWLHGLENQIKQLSKGKNANKSLIAGTVLILNNFSDNITTGGDRAIAICYDINVPLRNALLGRRTHFIKALSKTSKLVRYEIKPADQNFLYGRNMPNLKPLLTNTRIVVIGAGAIGGFLCSQLACLGCGSGKHGELVIIDDDVIMPGNTGRHLLGVDHIRKKKAESVASTLLKSHPSLSISFRNDRFENVLDDLHGDLIVNATGMQTVGVALESLLKPKSATPPILHAWIEGQGAAARTILNDHAGYACFRCIWEQSETGPYLPTFPLLRPDSKVEVTPAGCHQSYFAYPVMAAVKAATLAADAITDFFNGKHEPRLRNLVIRRDQCLEPSDQNTPEKSNSCPVCR